MLTNKFSRIFNNNTITVDDEIVYTRLYASIYPKVTFVEDARPDYYVKRDAFDNILKEVYGSTGQTIYKVISSGNSLEVRVIDKYKTMIVMSFIMERDITDCAYRISGKDLCMVNELGDMDYLQMKLDKISTKVYNALELAPLVSEPELTQGIVRSMFYPLKETQRGNMFCTKYNEVRYDRVALRDMSKLRTKIGFDIPKDKE
jgi:hypothetical protein